jgi:hypothetical protein
MAVSGSGTWEASEREGLTTVSVSFDNGAEITGYEARRYGKALKLWTCVGDPDSGDFRVPTALRGKASRRPPPLRHLRADGVRGAPCPEPAIPRAVSARGPARFRPCTPKPGCYRRKPLSALWCTEDDDPSNLLRHTDDTRRNVRLTNMTIPATDDFRPMC